MPLIHHLEGNACAHGPRSPACSPRKHVPIHSQNPARPPRHPTPVSHVPCVSFSLLVSSPSLSRLLAVELVRTPSRCLKPGQRRSVHLMQRPLASHDGRRAELEFSHWGHLGQLVCRGVYRQRRCSALNQVRESLYSQGARSATWSWSGRSSVSIPPTRLLYQANFVATLRRRPPIITFTGLLRNHHFFNHVRAHIFARTHAIRVQPNPTQPPDPPPRPPVLFLAGP